MKGREMDEYYARMARESLHKAEGDLMNAQNYLIQANLWGWWIKDIKRLLNAIRREDDEIVARLEHKTQYGDEK
jgi:hypothetical protein